MRIEEEKKHIHYFRKKVIEGPKIIYKDSIKYIKIILIFEKKKYSKRSNLRHPLNLNRPKN